MPAGPEIRAEPVWPVAARLGEGPVWVDGRLFFVDIKGAAVHALTPATGRRQSWALPRPVVWLIPCTEPGSFVAGLWDAIVRLRLEPSLEIVELQRAHAEGAAPSLRLNDAKLDGAGRLWAGSMDDSDPSRPAGVLGRLDAKGRWQAADTGYHICNGPTFSLDGRTLYHADSWLGRVHAYELAADGGLGVRRLWRQFGAGEGVPDGMCTDADGCLWIAHWGGARVSRYNPAGDCIGTIALPVDNVSSCAFGGPTLQQLYITTASIGLSQPRRAHQPLAGGLFVVDLSAGPLAATGLPQPRFGLPAQPARSA